jgi:type II secretory pathway component PulC
VTGLKFESIQSKSPYDRMGFKAGDILTKINGENANRPVVAMDFYRSLQAKETFCVTLLRDGKALNWTFVPDEKDRK